MTMAKQSACLTLRLSPDEEARFRQESFEKLRKQRIQQVREQEKKRAKLAAQTRQREERQFALSNLACMKQREYSILKQKLTELEGLKRESEARFGEAHRQANEARAENAVFTEVEKKKEAEQAKERAVRFMEAMKVQQASLLEKAQADFALSERRRIIHEEETHRAKMAASMAVFPPPKIEPPPPQRTVISDENGHIDYSKTRFHIWAGADGPTGLGPPPKPEPLPTEEREVREQKRTTEAFKVLRDKNETQKMEEALDAVAIAERRERFARNPAEAIRPVKLSVPIIVESRQGEIIWDPEKEAEEAKAKSTSPPPWRMQSSSSSGLSSQAKGKPATAQPKTKANAWKPELVLTKAQKKDLEAHDEGNNNKINPTKVNDDEKTRDGEQGTAKTTAHGPTTMDDDDESRNVPGNENVGDTKNESQSTSKNGEKARTDSVKTPTNEVTTPSRGSIRKPAIPLGKAQTFDDPIIPLWRKKNSMANASLKKIDTSEVAKRAAAAELEAVEQRIALRAEELRADEAVEEDVLSPAGPARRAAAERGGDTKERAGKEEKLVTVERRIASRAQALRASDAGEKSSSSHGHQHKPSSPREITIPNYNNIRTWTKEGGSARGSGERKKVFEDAGMKLEAVERRLGRKADADAFLSSEDGAMYTSRKQEEEGEMNAYPVSIGTARIHENDDAYPVSIAGFSEGRGENNGGDTHRDDGAEDNGEEQIEEPEPYVRGRLRLEHMDRDQLGGGTLFDPSQLRGKTTSTSATSTPHHHHPPTGASSRSPNGHKKQMEERVDDFGKKSGLGGSMVGESPRRRAKEKDAKVPLITASPPSHDVAPTRVDASPPSNIQKKQMQEERVEKQVGKKSAFASSMVGESPRRRAQEKDAKVPLITASPQSKSKSPRRGKDAVFEPEVKNERPTDPLLPSTHQDSQVLSHEWATKLLESADPVPGLKSRYKKVVTEDTCPEPPSPSSPSRGQWGKKGMREAHRKKTAKKNESEADNFATHVQVSDELATRLRLLRENAPWGETKRAESTMKRPWAHELVVDSKKPPMYEAIGTPMTPPLPPQGLWKDESPKVASPPASSSLRQNVREEPMGQPPPLWEMKKKEDGGFGANEGAVVGPQGGIQQRAPPDELSQPNNAAARNVSWDQISLLSLSLSTPPRFSAYHHEGRLSGSLNQSMSTGKRSVEIAGVPEGHIFREHENEIGSERQRWPEAMGGKSPDGAKDGKVTPSSPYGTGADKIRSPEKPPGGDDDDSMNLHRRLHSVMERYARDYGQAREEQGSKSGSSLNEGQASSSRYNPSSLEKNLKEDRVTIERSKMDESMSSSSDPRKMTTRWYSTVEEEEKDAFHSMASAGRHTGAGNQQQKTVRLLPKNTPSTSSFVPPAGCGETTGGASSSAVPHGASSSAVPAEYSRIWRKDYDLGPGGVLSPPTMNQSQVGSDRASDSSDRVFKHSAEVDDRTKLSKRTSPPTMARKAADDEILGYKSDLSKETASDKAPKSGQGEEGTSILSGEKSISQGKSPIRGCVKEHGNGLSKGEQTRSSLQSGSKQSWLLDMMDL